MGKPEGIVEGYLRDQCQAHNALCYKFVSPGYRGVPDDIVIYDGKTVYVETKSATGDLQVIQKKRIADMKAHGADVRVCHTRKSIDDMLSNLIPSYKPKQQLKSTDKNPYKLKNKKNITTPVVIKSIREDT